MDSAKDLQLGIYLDELLLKAICCVPDCCRDKGNWGGGCVLGG